MHHIDSQAAIAKQRPDFSRERAALRRGALRVAGVDEAGRGPLAGPVVAAAVVLDIDDVPEGLNDSKALSAKRREALFLQLTGSAAIGVAAAPPALIEKLNIRGATLWAMRRAVLALPVAADHVLIDGRDIPPGLPMPGEALTGGDRHSVSIAAASIVAKVMRDAMCPVMDRDAPGYGFAAHKGYGTAIHIDALSRKGPTGHHRAGFGPVKAAAERRLRLCERHLNQL